jgi:hypothetical protein
MKKKVEAKPRAPQVKLSGNIIADPEKGVPKFATAVHFTVSDRGDVFMMFLNQNNPAKDAVLIETIMIDPGHLKKLATILARIVEENEKN